jgi:baseplate upper protein BppU
MSKITLSEPYVIGEKPSPLVYQFQDSGGTAINITGFTAKFLYQEHDGAAVTANAAVSDGPNGKAQYTFTGNEFATAGHYRAAFVVGNGTNRYESVEINFDVSTGVGTMPSI